MGVREKSPRISINKLVEYLEANSTRRKRIVLDQKKPYKPIVTRYKEADDAILKYITSGFDEIVLSQAIEELEGKECVNDHQIQDRDLSIELLELIPDIEFPNFDGCTLSEYSGDNPKLDISGVDVSVRPEIIIRKGDSIGAIKIHRGKTFTLDQELLKCASLVVHQFIDEHVAEDLVDADKNLCFAIDCFNGLIEEAPNSSARRMSRLETACQEITLWWNAV